MPLPPLVGSPSTSDEHYLASPDGLYLIAYRGFVPLPPKAGESRIRFRQWEFSSLRELAFFADNVLTRHAKTRADSFLVEDTPLPELVYPLYVGSSWTYRAAGNPWHIQKEVVGFERLLLVADRYDCFKVQWLIDFDDDGAPDRDVEFFDWVSADGIVLRRMIFRDLEWIGLDGERLGLFDTWDESTVLTIEGAK